VTAGAETPISGTKEWAAEWRALSAIRPYEQNPRQNADAVAKVAASIREFGWRAPIVVDEDGVILAGHTRLLAAQALGLAEVPVHTASGLTGAQARAYRLADNRTAQEATWDWDALRLEIGALKDADFDLDLTGFDADELAGLLADGSQLQPGADPDEAPPLPTEPITQPGDLIRLGRHRLLCGDATEATAWEALMGGEAFALLWTDPPYGVDYASKNAMLNARDGGKRIETPIEGDAQSSPELTDLLRSSFSLAFAHSKAGGAWYVAGPQGGALSHSFASVLLELGLLRHTLQWVKNQFVLGRCDYHYRHEPIFYGWKDGAAHTWHGGHSQDSVLEFDRPRRSELHPTMKPVALVQRCLENSSDPGALVCDPFAGSGTTLIAAEASGRRAAVMELTPAYCDVIVTRWEQATGLTAERP